MGVSSQALHLVPLLKAAVTRRVTKPTVFLTSVCFLDMAHTLFAVRMGIAIEANPLLRPFIETSDSSFIVIKTMSFLVPLAVAEVLRPHRRHFIKKALMVGSFAYPAAYLLGIFIVH